MADPASQPLLSFGLIADAQYADLPDGNTEGRQQRFSEVPGKLRQALAALAAHAPPLAAVLHLGDINNGECNPAGQAQCEAELDMMARIFEEELPASIPAVHVIGNHCLSVPRDTLLRRLGIPPSCYYSRSLGHGWRLIMLDTTEMSGHSGYPEESEQYQEAQEFVAAHPLSEEEPQMSSWNGGITRRQLAWLEAELAAAEAAGERVVVASHHQVGEGGARPTHMCWNWHEVQAALLASPAFRVAFAGHDHVGGYACIDGRHFVTLEALLEAPAGSNAYAVVHLHADELAAGGDAPRIGGQGLLRIEGHGTVTSRRLAV